MSKVELVEARASVKSLKAQLVEARAQVKALRDFVKYEKNEARTVKRLLRADKAYAARVKRTDRIARMKARLAVLEAKQLSPKAIKRANRKASKPVTASVTA